MSVPTNGDRDPGVLGPVTPSCVEVLGFDALFDRGAHVLCANPTVAHKPLALLTEVYKLVSLLGIVERVVDRHRIAAQGHDGAPVGAVARDLQPSQPGQ